MDKDTRILVASLGAPLVLAICGWVNSHRKVEVADRTVEVAEKETLEMSDSFQSYVEYVMKQRGCEP